MKNNSEIKSTRKKKYSKILQLSTTIYAIAYIVLILSFFIVEKPTFAVTPEAIIVSIAFIVFIIGYYYTWKNYLIAGSIFIVWWGIMWYLGIYIAKTDKGAGVVMGLPLFIIGILLIVSWYRNK